MDPRLIQCLASVRRQFQRLRYWQIVAISTGIAALAMYLAAWRQDLFRFSSLELTTYQSLAVVVGVLAVIVIVAWIISASSYANLRKLASRVEQKYPELNERLLAAIDQVPESGQGLSYLQRRVVDAAVAHHRKTGWQAMTSSLQLNLLQFITILFAGFVLFSSNRLTFTGSLLSETPIAAEELQGLEFEVLPGDVEVERGSNVVVTAKFSKENVPADVDLVANRDGQPLRTRMVRNLDDPTFGGYLVNIDNDFTYQVEASERLSQPYKITVFEYPKMLRSDASISPPSYSGQPAKIVENTLRVTAAEGTILTWIIYTNKEVAKATLIDRDGEEIEMSGQANEPTKLTAEIELTKSRRWTLKLVDRQGRENKFPPSLVATVLPNKPAELKLTSIGDATVSPIEELPVSAEIKDDFGIQRIGLTYAIGNAEPREVELTNTKNEIDPPAKIQTVQHVVDLEQVAAEADQLLSYHFWAEDTDSSGKVRRTSGDIFFAEVRPFEQIFREGSGPGGESPPPSQAQQQQAQQAEQLAELQKEIVSATWNLIRRADLAVELGSKELATNLIPDVQTIEQSQQSAIEQLAQLTENLPPDRSPELVTAVEEFMQRAVSDLQQAMTEKTRSPLDQAVTNARNAYQALLKLRAREFDVVQQNQQQQQGGSASRSNMQRQLDQLELKNDPNRYQQQQTAQPEQQSAAQQAQQFLNRLKDLAKRQQDLNEQLKAAELELQMAQTEEEREEALRKLERLREQQQDLLQDLDDLTSDLNAQPQQDAATQQAAQQLQETRENVRNAQEALERQQPSEALTAGSRAERQLDDLQEEFQKESAAALGEKLKELTEQSRDLVDQQEQINEQLNSIAEPSQTPGLRASDDSRKQTAENLNQQAEKLENLIENIRETVVESEESQPLLAEQLYEAQAEAQQRETADGLRLSADLLSRGFDAETEQAANEISENLKQLDQRLQKAAEQILGDPTQALTRAKDQLQQLAEQLDSERGPQDERDQQPGQSQSQQENSQQENSSQPGQQAGSDSQAQQSLQQQQSSQQQSSANPSANQSEPSSEPSENSGPADSRSEQPGSEQSGQPTESPTSSNQQPSASAQASSQQTSSSPSSSSPSSSSPSSSQQASSQQQASSGSLLDGNWADILGGEDQPRPITGDGFRDWAERLRQVEDMLQDSELRSQAATIRDRAREMRREVTRHSKEPQWDEIEKMLAEPLQQLRQRVDAEILRRSAERNAIVPMDRDPVPDQFSEAVRKYYEQVGAGR